VRRQQSPAAGPNWQQASAAVTHLQLSAGSQRQPVQPLSRDTLQRLAAPPRNSSAQRRRRGRSCLDSAAAGRRRCQKHPASRPRCISELQLRPRRQPGQRRHAAALARQEGSIWHHPQRRRSQTLQRPPHTCRQIGMCPVWRRLVAAPRCGLQKQRARPPLRCAQTLQAVCMQRLTRSPQRPTAQRSRQLSRRAQTACGGRAHLSAARPRSQCPRLRQQPRPAQSHPCSQSTSITTCAAGH